MTRKLEELFDLPSPPEAATAESDNDIEHNLPVLSESLRELDKIEAALPLVKGLESSDIEMDDLSGKATESYENLMDLGMQVDSRYASEIFSVASQMLGHAITAKTAKLNKKLKMIDLQLKKARLDQTNDAPSINNQGVIIDRNELLDRLLKKDNTNKNDKP